MERSSFPPFRVFEVDVNLLAEDKFLQGIVIPYRGGLVKFQARGHPASTRVREKQCHLASTRFREKQWTKCHHASTRIRVIWLKSDLYLLCLSDWSRGKMFVFLCGNFLSRKISVESWLTVRAQSDQISYFDFYNLSSSWIYLIEFTRIGL